MLAVLCQRNFAFLWLSGLISGVGTWALYTALPYYVYDRTGSALATGAMVVVQTVPRIALSSVAGVWADRWDRKQTMVLTDLVRALFLLLLLGVRSSEWLWAIYAVAFAEAAVSQFFDRARDALLPGLVEAQALTAANALDGATGPLIRLVAPALGGALLALLGVTFLILVDVASYLASAVLILLISLPPRHPDSRTVAGRAEKSAVGAAWADWRSGVREIVGEPILRALFLIGGLVLVGYGMITVLLVLFARDVLQGSALVFGWLVTAQGIGGLLGAIGTDRLAKLLSPARIVGLGLVATGLLYLLVANVPRVAVDVALVAVVGLPIAGYWVSARTLLQTCTPDAYRGRVFGAYETISSLTTLVGIGLAGGGAGLLGVVPMLDVAAAFYVLGGVVALACLGATQKGAGLDLLPSPSSMERGRG